MKQKKKKTFLEYKNMPGEKTLEDAIKALEKALKKPRFHPAKAYNRKQRLDLEFAEVVCSQATDSLISLAENYPCLLDEPLPQGPDPIQRMKEILRRFKKALVKLPAGTGEGNKGVKRKWEGFKNFGLIMYEKTMKSFFDSITGR